MVTVLQSVLPSSGLSVMFYATSASILQHMLPSVISTRLRTGISPQLPQARGLARRSRRAVRQLPALAAASQGLTRPAGSATYITQTLRAGKVQEHAGTVVVFGDVKHGATIIAGGDVLVWGKLQGEVHAGGRTDRQATIAALHMSPQQLRIADVAAYGSRHLHSAGHPEIAVVNNNRLQIELLPFDGTQSGQAPHLLANTKSKPNEPASAAMFTGAYILVAGLALMFFPLLTFGLLFSPTILPIGWIRVGGVLASLYGFYYLGAGFGDTQQQGLSGFYRSTIWGRLFLFVAFSVIVLRQEVDRMLMLPAIVNVLGAIAMHMALSKQQQQQA